MNAIDDFHRAIANNRWDVIGIYTDEKGVDINAINKRGDTALHVAIKSSDRYTIEQLLKAGADKSIRDGKGRTAVELDADWMFGLNADLLK